MKKVLIYLNEHELTQRGGPLGYNYNLRDKHMHPLEILEKSFFICCICGKTDNLKKTFVFYCEDCNFAICPQCYFSK